MHIKYEFLGKIYNQNELAELFDEIIFETAMDIIAEEIAELQKQHSCKIHSVDSVTYKVLLNEKTESNNIIKYIIIVEDCCLNEDN